MFPIKRSVLSYFLEANPTAPAHVPGESPASGKPIIPKSIPDPKPVTPEPIPQPYMDIFCDGACIGNGSHRARAGFGLYVKQEGKYLTEVSEALEELELVESLPEDLPDDW